MARPRAPKPGEPGGVGWNYNGPLSYDSEIGQYFDQAEGYYFDLDTKEKFQIDQETGVEIPVREDGVASEFAENSGMKFGRPGIDASSIGKKPLTREFGRRVTSPESGRAAVAEFRQKLQERDEKPLWRRVFSV